MTTKLHLYLLCCESSCGSRVQFGTESAYNCMAVYFGSTQVNLEEKLDFQLKNVLYITGENR